jgi:DNA primase
MLDVQAVVNMLGLRNVSLRGDELSASCPFPENHHGGDANPSWGMNITTGLWSCFGCGEKGNLEQLIERVVGVDRLEAMRLAYGDLGLDEVQSLMSGEAVASVAQMTPLQRDISSWATNEHPYWHGRGFNDETIGHWQLGYSPEMNRVTVPIWANREIVGWTARRVVETDEPKWRHSPGLSRQSLLFGADDADGDSCIVVEAPLSVVMLWQQGIRNAVATLGCKMSLGQADLIRSRFSNVLMFYDPDDAGRGGTRRAIDMLSPFVNVFCVRQTRDDPAAMTVEENSAALSDVVPSFAYGIAP